MILTKEQIARIMKGHLSISEEHGYYCLHRYHESQEFYYEDTNSDYYLKTHATSGLRFDFITDSLELSFDFELHSASSRRFYYFDVQLDGKPFAHIGEEKASKRRDTFTLHLPAGEKRVTVWFPCMFAVYIKNVTLDDGCKTEAASCRGSYLAIGDSITHGYDAVYSSCTYPALVAQALELDLINQGIGGDMYHVGNLGDGIGFQPDYITVALGTNDWANRKKHRFDEDVVAFYKKLAQLYPDSKLAVITPWWRGDIDNVTEVGSFDYAVEKIREAASVFPGAVFINGLEILEHKKSLFSPDVLHPNDLGFQNMASNLVPALRKAFSL